MQKIENETNTVTLETLGNDIMALNTSKGVINATVKVFTANALTLISDMVTLYPTLKGSKEYSAFNVLFEGLTFEENTVTEEAINTIQGIKHILNTTEVEAKKEYYAILIKIQENSRTTLTMYRDLLKSKSVIDKGQTFLDDYEYIAKIANILTSPVDKNDEILQPKKAIGQLYPTEAQIAEMKPTAKKTISFGRECKKIGSKIGGALKQYDEKTVDNDKFVEFLKNNIEEIVAGYIVERDTKDTKNPTNADLKAKIAELEEQLKSKDTTATKKVAKKVA